MRHYTKSEIKEILERHSQAQFSFSAEDRDFALVNPSLDTFLRVLKSDTAELKTQPDCVIPFSLFRRYEEDGNRKEYEDMYFKRRQKLLAYSLHFWLYEDEDTLKHLCDVIWAISEEYTWSLPAHLMGRGLHTIQSDDTYTVDLFAAETAEALSEALSLVKDRLPKIIIDRVHFEIERRVLSRAYAKIDEFFWHKTANNWSAVCAGSVGMTAMYEISDTERLAEIIEITLSTLENFYAGFSLDGACLEGISYWNYGFGYFMSFADMLYKRTEGEINLFGDPHIKNIAFFYTKVFFKGARTVSFSDSATSGRCALAQLSILKRYYPDFEIPGADYISFGYSGRGCARFALSLRDLVYTLPNLKTEKRDITGTYVLPYAEWYISSSENGTGIAAKAGNNDEPHNHNDVGSFEIYKNGKQIIADIGAGEYTRQYFEFPERYDIFCNSSASHSVPVINGEYQKAGSNYAAKDIHITEKGICADISGAYEVDTLEALVRDISFDSVSGETLIKDTFVFSEKPVSVAERFITSVQPTLLPDKVVIDNAGEIMSIYYEAEKVIPDYHVVVDKDHKALERQTYVVDFNVKNSASSIELTFVIK